MQIGRSQVSPAQPLAQVHLSGSEHDPCSEQTMEAHTASRHLGPCQLFSHLQTPGCWQTPCPQPASHMGAAHVGPSQPVAQVHVSGAVH